MAGPKFYAVRVGITPGIYHTWAECEPQIFGVKGAKYKSFPTEAQAEEYLNAGDGPIAVLPGEAPDEPEAPKKPRKTIPPNRRFLTRFLKGCWSPSWTEATTQRPGATDSGACF